MDNLQLRIKKVILLFFIVKISALYSLGLNSYDINERPDSISVNKTKLTIAMSSSVFVVAGAYYAVKTAWWYDISPDFHFDQGADLHYSKNLDKVAHLFGGYVVQDLYYRSFRWSNMKEETALWTSFGFSVFVQVMIDIKDGYAPHWGFSLYDVGAGALGASFPVFQHYYPFLKNYKLKMSYWYKDDDYGSYPRNEAANIFEELPVEDYPNQTYWLTWNVDQVIPKKYDKYWPDFLDIAIGMGVDDLIDYPDTNGSVEWYLAFDYDLEVLVKNVDSPIVKSIAHYLNYIKFPSPAIRFTPEFKAYGFYF
ncbi:MAG: DUF2279 domain-containing protein [Candidatus Delongbacteria bacterium]|nr:DUF2279 domain-containing protein [Candidatus Delongbacteria bacterium]